MNEFILPDIGEGIVECELLEWLVKEGDVIVEDQPVAEVMTDKATVQIPAMHNGVVRKLHYKEGDIAKVHAPLFAMDIEGEDSDEANTPAANSDAVVNESSVKEAPAKSHNVSSTETQSGAGSSEKIEAFILPDIGEGIVECEIVKWCIEEGDLVEEDQVVVEVMTDKAVVEIPAKYQGKVVKLHYRQGDIAQVHTPLFDQLILADGATTTDAAANSDTKAEQESSSKSASSQATTQQVNTSNEVGTAESNRAKALASPAVRRIAREYKINIAMVAGSGKKGRVLKQDIELYVQSGGADKQTTQQAPSASTTNSVVNDGRQANSGSNVSSEVSKVIAMRGIKAAMAKQMMASVSTIPHFTVSDELIMDNLIALRAQLKPEFEQQGVKLSFMPFFIKSLSLALKSFPEINSRLTKDDAELHYLTSHNIGMAVDSKIGLLVPNIKNVQDLSLFEVAQECDRIINAAREGKLSNTDLSNGTISISNIGALGGITATPVINKPEVAIVALGKTQKLPRFNDAGEVFAQSIMMVNWSGDHRVIDGATMVRFNNLWMSYLQSPQKMLVHLK
ncbi:dihydrolipoyllysine-residue acetyltransferase [Brumicola nitratireducens]|uniref:Dihydrolipoamide acetyltransferase component of pyruvate dehydrogenase complex n=1 Tax=Glaciecola nitratireducens (strain JCM 12485 / KCTC 12276 / FR1064) TaxID=1085623 RepID=G4QHM2_GLANF|nr:dihydrolipoyllysine-residue acetyltransferase [Glaciecola nitratireducens]AEP30008.1 dihydrolipoamide acetyltransferase [Glaciecola nitratireducens FR1064]